MVVFYPVEYPMRIQMEMRQAEREAAADVPVEFHKAIGKPHGPKRVVDWEVRVWALPRIYEFSRIPEEDKAAKTEYLNKTCKDLANRFPDLSPKAPQRQIYQQPKKIRQDWKKVSLALHRVVFVTHGSYP